MARQIQTTAPIQPVILCGGSGTRLWPVSRQALPKQFAPLASKQSLLQDTVSWVRDETLIEDPMLISNERFQFLITEQMEEIGVEPSALILEPMARNTAPAIALAALKASEIHPDACLLVLPSDHVLTNKDAFTSALNQGLAAARDGFLVTFGIAPTHPETGYGYIRKGAHIPYGSDCTTVHQFVEKPDIETATRYVESGDFAWNSGMFMFTARRYLAELERHHPMLIGLCNTAMATAKNQGNAWTPNAETFSQCQDISIDYAVMEKTNDAVCVTSYFGWSDVGSWPAVGALKEVDENGNASIGDVIMESCANTYVHGNGRLVATVGLEDVLVVDSGDAVLVAAKGQAQEVKAIVDRLKVQKREEAVLHPKVHRPWGTYEGIHLGGSHQVKHIVVKPGAKLSSQYHHHRAEHWIIVSGTAEVTVGEETKTMTENESVYIPVEAIHRLHNPSDEPLHLIEVQYGSYLGEDDIVRLDDDYGRIETQPQSLEAAE